MKKLMSILVAMLFAMSLTVFAIAEEKAATPDTSAKTEQKAPVKKKAAAKKKVVKKAKKTKKKATEATPTSDTK
jgi:hypothetical protein